MKLTRVLRSIFSGAVRLHFSQYGEDVYLNKKFRSYSSHYYYIDIGAHHPFHLSNTNVLWVKGWNGVNVDASKKAVKIFEKKKPKDLNLNFAVVSQEFSNKNKFIEFYSSKEVDNCASCDPEIAKERGLSNVVQVPCISLPAILKMAKENFDGRFGLLNIDIEGLDEQVVETIAQWDDYPEVLMIEIYAKSIEALLELKAYKAIKDCGYTLVQKSGHTCIFERVLPLN